MLEAELEVVKREELECWSLLAGSASVAPPSLPQASAHLTTPARKRSVGGGSVGVDSEPLPPPPTQMTLTGSNNVLYLDVPGGVDGRGRGASATRAGRNTAIV